jgi:hypothetical protein
MATLPQTLTPYHAKYYAYELTRRCPPDSDDRLANALVDAQVDLNPHQIDAALFSFKSPLSRGVLLADEVGLGKTIEAGLVLAQRWAERKRRILVITPSNLRKQWHQELTDKFFLPCRILEAKSYNDAIKAGQFRPFELDGQIVICSYQFARKRVAFDKATELGGVKKAIIFTESRKTQRYLQRLLADSPWKDGLVLFNGSNTDELSRAIYAEWRDKHEGTDHVTGSKTADMRSALVDYFRDRGQIMIATEAGAEGINLQFCSLVVNYDLPWNPQRIEQRIGRCHRYGQKHDVVVVNFLNKKNAADQRVFQLLSEKFRLFEGVFGASDEVLGAIESGVDFEKRIATIYQQCRKTDEIQTAFDRLQLELDFEITDTLNKARQQLLEHFDDEVREKLRIRNESSRAALNRYEQRLMALTRFELGDDATFASDASFDLHRSPLGTDVPTGRYELPRRSGDAHFYRLNHPLAEAVVERAKSRDLAEAEGELEIPRGLSKRSERSGQPSLTSSATSRQFASPLQPASARRD